MPEPTTKQIASAEKKSSINVATFLTPLGVFVFVILVLILGYIYTKWRLTDLKNAINYAKHPTVTTTRTTSSTLKPATGLATPSPQSSPSSTTTVAEQETTAQDKLVTFEKDRADLEIKMMTGVVQLLGGLFVAVTAYVSWQNLKQTKNNVVIAEKNLRATEDKNVAERYTKAIEQLGNGNIAVRFGGIYALEQIAKDKDSAEKYHWTVMEVLTSFIQEQSPVRDSEQSEEKLLEKITKDVQAALTVIGRRKKRPDLEPEKIDLSQAYLAKANLVKAHLNGAKLLGTYLVEADLSDAYLVGADLHCAKLNEAHLVSAHLMNVDLRGADLIGTYLMDADLQGAKLDMADLRGAKLNHAILKGVSGLTVEQVESTCGWKEADYDPNFRQQLGLPPKQES